MKRNFKEAIKNRRSNYSFSDKSPVPDEEIENIAKFALMNVPSAFNSQSTRIVLLFGSHHGKFWDIVKNTLKARISAEAFVKMQNKIDSSFASGHGTVLFYEDQNVVRELQRNFESYKDKFPQWSEHTAGMHQFAVWIMLEDAGLGASLQHYNPIIDDEVRKTWNISESWKLIAQMPFGLPKEQPEPKEKQPVEERMKVFKS